MLSISLTQRFALTDQGGEDAFVVGKRGFGAVKLQVLNLQSHAVESITFRTWLVTTCNQIESGLAGAASELFCDYRFQGAVFAADIFDGTAFLDFLENRNHLAFTAFTFSPEEVSPLAVFGPDTSTVAWFYFTAWLQQFRLSLS